MKQRGLRGLLAGAVLPEVRQVDLRHIGLPFLYAAYAACKLTVLVMQFRQATAVKLGSKRPRAKG